MEKAWIDRSNSWTLNQFVVGSIPAQAAIFKRLNAFREKVPKKTVVL
jgi:hypothetical protein